MRYWLCLWVVLSGCASGAQMVAYGERGAVVILSEAKCANPEILDTVRDEYRDKFKAGEASIYGSTVAMCWIRVEDSVFVAFEGEARVTIPMAKFVPYDGQSGKPGI